MPIVGYEYRYPPRHSSPSWSADGRIVFRDEGITCVSPEGAAYRDTSLVGIWILDPATKVRQRLFPDGYTPAFSPSGDAIAFEFSFQIFVLDLNSLSLRQLTSYGKNFAPAWDPSGEHIYFDSNGGASLLYRPWVINRDGSGLQRVCLDNYGRTPSVDRLGAIALVQAGVGIVLLDSCTTKPVVTGFNYLGDPEFSPSGDRISFSAYRVPNPLAQIWIVDRDGRNLRQLTQHGGIEPTWSPDGGSIAYVQRNDRDSSSVQGTLHVLRIDMGTDSSLVAPWPSTCP